MFDMILALLTTLEVQLVFKLLLIFVLSGVIGLQRAALSKPAGFGTHVLVGISAVLVMECGIYLQNMMNADPTRIAAQFLSGIGFLGAGTILSDGFSVKGLTTAASLLAVACIGLVVGAGFYFAGIVATIVVYFVLTYSKFISDKVSHSNEINLEIQVKNEKEVLEKMQEFFEHHEIEITEMKTLEDKEYIKIAGSYREKNSKNKVMAELISMEDVKQVGEV